MNQTIIISARDENRLRRLLGGVHPTDPAQRDSLLRLAGELDQARILPDSEVPPDIVTLGSTVELEDMDDGEILTYTLVFPWESNASQGRISILAPLGSGMLGYRLGSEFKWPVPGGVMHARIRRVVHHANEQHSLNAIP